MAKRIPYNKKTRGPPELSKDFGMKMIEKELELEKNWDISILNELVIMYTEIIEYYEYNKDPRYLDFQDRMHKMLIKPQAIYSMKLDSASSPKNGQSLRTEAPKNADSKEIEIKINKINSEDERVETGKKAVEMTMLIEESELPVKSETLSRPPQNRLKRSTSGLPARAKKESVEEIIEKRKKESEIKKSYLSAQLNHAISQPSYKTTKNLDRLISRHQSSTKEITSRANLDFKNQDSDLRRRVASRKQIMLNRSLNGNSMETSASPLHKSGMGHYTDSEELDLRLFQNSSPEPMISITSVSSMPYINHVSSLSDQLEEVMEKCFEEKANKINEIKLNYEVQIKELEGQGGIMSMITDQMRANMNEEIQEVSREQDIMRRTTINSLKRSFIL